MPTPPVSISAATITSQAVPTARRTLTRGAQHFFGVVFPDILAGDGGDANAIDDGAVVPWLAHAVAVHIAHAHVGHHLWRRHGDDLDILDRADAHGAYGGALQYGAAAEFGLEKISHRGLFKYWGGAFVQQKKTSISRVPASVKRGKRMGTPLSFFGLRYPPLGCACQVTFIGLPTF